MKYYKINIKTLYQEDDRIASSAEGGNIDNADYYFIKMDNGEMVYGAPVFDYFSLESFDKKEYWDWILTDVFDFIGKGSRIPGWLISKRFKELLEKFKITEPHFYYLSKLLYKGDKLDYYIFQFSGNNIVEKIRAKINFEQCIFFDPNNAKDIFVNSKDEFVTEKKRIRKESMQHNKDSKIEIKTLVLKENLDFFPMYNFLEDNIISEKLKQSIEENGISGFEFSELDYEVVIGKP